jgi:hypothetical protein
MSAKDSSLKLIVTSVDSEADGGVSLRLADESGADLPPWNPGALIDLMLGELSRQYSLCGDSADSKHYQVAALLEPSGRGGSRFVHEVVRPGDLLGARPPRNHFEFLDAQHYLFIADQTFGVPECDRLAERGDALPAHLFVDVGGESRAASREYCGSWIAEPAA